MCIVCRLPLNSNDHYLTCPECDSKLMQPYRDRYPLGVFGGPSVGDQYFFFLHEGTFHSIPLITILHEYDY